ncbi:hypothetical protein E2C01_043274 [Portunus trituberculatus]|uniref:Uncharacterized protein n=1 Tax=Portunus trituberculatus TaxID=210409 RepID=A0A5B7FSJ1_PORTR|nr:hypothetical protein [Portunus trituberculatus]
MDDLWRKHPSKLTALRWVFTWSTQYRQQLHETLSSRYPSLEARALVIPNSEYQTGSGSPKLAYWTVDIQRSDHRLVNTVHPERRGPQAVHPQLREHPSLHTIKGIHSIISLNDPAQRPFLPLSPP